MLIIYDNEKIKQLVSSLSDAIGTRITFYDSDSNIIVQANNLRRRFCLKLFENEKELKMCRENYVRSSNIRLEYEKGDIIPMVFDDTCRWGFVDCFYHIVNNGVLLGFVQYGSMRTCSQMDELEYKSELTSAELDELKDFFDESEYYSPKKVLGIHELIKLFADYIVKKEYVRIKFDKTIEKAEKYIEEHLDKKLSVDIICNAISVSRSTLYSKFASELKTTINEYVIQRRIIRAKTLLLDTQKSIANVCDEIGFENSYFSKVFKRETGVSPLEYRRRNVIG